jgi:hypothetical protein
MLHSFEQPCRLLLARSLYGKVKANGEEEYNNDVAIVFLTQCVTPGTPNVQVVKLATAAGGHHHDLRTLRRTCSAGTHA